MPLLLVLAGVAWLVVTYRRRGTRPLPPELGPAGWVGPMPWSIVGPLGRVEAFRLLVHPAFLIGVALTPLFLLMIMSEGNQLHTWRALSPGIALALVPLCWLTILAAHLSATRPDRAGTSELFATLPAAQPVRTAGQLVSVITACGVTAVLAVAAVMFASTNDRFTGSPIPAEIAAALCIAAGSVAVGVAVARYLRHPFFGVLAAMAPAFIQVRFFEIDSWPWNLSSSSPYRFLGFLAEPLEVDAGFEIRPIGWHLVYLVALAVVVGCVALARTGVPRPLAATLALALVVGAVAGWAQTRPPSAARVEQMLAMLQHPEREQACHATGTVTYCAAPADTRVDGWRPPVSAVLGLLPTAVSARPMRVAARVPTIAGNSNCAPEPFTDRLVPEVARRIDPALVWARDRDVHPGVDTLPCSSESTKGLFLAVQVGAWSVGLPPSPHGRDVRCTADNAARSVVALWLGASAVPDGPRRLASIAKQSAGWVDFDGWNNPPMWGVAFRTSDARLAVALARRPVGQIRRIVHENWALLSDRATPASTLAELAGVRVGAVSPISSPRPQCP